MAPEIYVVEDSSDVDASSDVEIVSGKPSKTERAAAIAPRIAQLQAESSAFRLSKKPADNSMTKKTKSFLSKKQAMFAAATSHAHSSLIQFRAEIYFMNDAGKKTKTSIPIHARSFSNSDVSS